MMEPDDVYLCHKCGKIFYKLSTLESHSRWKHAEKTNEFMCDQCGRTFQKKYNLIKHLESAVHEISESVNCALCDFKALNRKLMCEHYQSFHEILLKETNVYFKTAEEFFVWKSEFEQKTKSRFVKMSSSRMRKNGFIRSTYFCHRDGNFVPKGRNLRHMKVKGSNKINAHCPAKIEVEIGERITIVSYIDIHLGHDQDLSRMSIDPADKVLIARKLALKVPFEQILDEVNNFKKEGELKRVNLLTRKDLWNIVDTFKINPKNVVFSKNRLRKKKRLEDMRREQSRRNTVSMKVYNCESNCEKVEVVYGDNEEEEKEHTGGQIISLKQENEENIVFYPVADESNPYVQEYSLIANESDEESGTCLIINANGELQSISGHKIIYTAEGNIEICDALEMDESEMVIDEPSLSSQIETCDVESSTINSEEKENFVSEIVLTNDPTASDGQEFEMETIQCATSFNENIIESVVDSVIDHESEDNSIVKTNIEEGEASVKPEIVFIKTENDEDITDQAVLSMKDDITQYEVTISNYDGEDENEYVVISTDKDDSLGECNMTSANSYTDNDACLETVVLDSKESDPGCSVVVSKAEIDNIESCEEHASNELSEPKWDVKRKEALHKLLNVHNLINSEQQLQVFSNNISTLENVLKALSKGNNQDSD